VLFSFFTFSLDYGPEATTSEESTTLCPDNYAILIEVETYLRCEDFNYYYETKDKSVLFFRKRSFASKADSK